MTDSNVRFASAGLFVAIFFVLGTLSGSAVGQQKAPAGSRAVPGKPVYNEATKSYFELRVDLPPPYYWGTAVKYARTKRYKGVRGRLAVVRDLETHSFLQANFDVREEVWIGLRYYCSFRKLVWSDGTEQPRSKFKMWARKWHRTKIRCGKTRIQFMPIYYLPSQQGFRWQAAGPSKQFASYLVEYVTGSENPEANKPEAAKTPAAKTPLSPKPETALEANTKNQ